MTWLLGNVLLRSDCHLTLQSQEINRNNIFPCCRMCWGWPLLIFELAFFSLGLEGQGNLKVIRCSLGKALMGRARDRKYESSNLLTQDLMISGYKRRLSKRCRESGRIGVRKVIKRQLMCYHFSFPKRCMRAIKIRNNIFFKSHLGLNYINPSLNL